MFGKDKIENESKGELTEGKPTSGPRTSIKPTIGRVVWFWPAEITAIKPDSQPQVALITYVHSDTMVNLAVFRPTGELEPKTSVTLWQGDGHKPQSYFAEWMPYQLQAATQKA